MLRHSAAIQTVGAATRKHQDLFDENYTEIQALLDVKHCQNKTYLNDSSSESKKTAFLNIHKTVQLQLRPMQNAWLSQKVEEIQSYAGSNITTRFYDTLKSVYGPQPSGISPLLCADGTTLLTEKDKILGRWAEHFNSVLNQPPSINEDVIKRLPQVEMNLSLADPPTVEETKKAIGILLSGKAPGADAIAEVYKVVGPRLVEKLTGLFQSLWRQEAVP